MELYGRKVNQLARYFTKKLNEKISPLGLYSSQWAIILYLNEKTQCTQVELSHYLCVESPTITRTLIRMEELGWVIRKEGKDKRERLIRLTEKANDMFPKWYEAAESVERQVVGGIPKEELEILSNIIGKIMKDIE